MKVSSDETDIFVQNICKISPHESGLFILVNIWQKKYKHIV